jgi:hypothetical protein
MPRPVPLPIRQALVRAHRLGQPPAQLAQTFSLPTRTVYHLLQQTRSHAEVPGTAYHPPPNGPRADDAIVRQAHALRQQHPAWGAPLIRIILARHFPDQTMPSARTLQRWLGKPRQTTPRLDQPHPAYQRASAVHESWQVDAADRMPLASGELVCWLRILDECSGAVLKTWVFPDVWNALPAVHSQEALRQAWTQWGLPGRLRLDNGIPWGSWNDLPTALGLWVVGLGVDLLFNPPGKPQHNGVVEKSQDTGQRWAEPEAAQTVEQLQGCLDEMDHIQREEYPSFVSQSRMAVFPQLVHSGRAYSKAWEQRNWSLKRAEAYLAEKVAVRKANRQGQVSVYNRNYCLGVLHKEKSVFVQYDPQQHAWLFADEQGRQLRHVPAPEISRKRILALDVSAP